MESRVKVEQFRCSVIYNTSDTCRIVRQLSYFKFYLHPPSKFKIYNMTQSFYTRLCGQVSRRVFGESSCHFMCPSPLTWDCYNACDMFVICNNHDTILPRDPSPLIFLYIVSDKAIVNRPSPFDIKFLHIALVI